MRKTLTSDGEEKLFVFEGNEEKFFKCSTRKKFLNPEHFSTSTFKDFLPSFVCICKIMLAKSFFEARFFEFSIFAFSFQKLAPYEKTFQMKIY